MKELKEYFSGKGQVKGYVFDQVFKTEYGYIYEVKGVKTVHYEVFERKENTMYNCVSYPTDKAFGLWAWTCASFGNAKDKLDQIGFRVEQRENA